MDDEFTIWTLLNQAMVIEKHQSAAGIRSNDQDDQGVVLNGTWDVWNSTKRSENVVDATEQRRQDEVDKSAASEQQDEEFRTTDAVVELQQPLPF